MLNLTSEEKAYIAGIIDGEGCISASSIKTRRSTTIKIRLIISNSNKKLSKWLLSKIGIGYIREHSNKRNKRNNWKLQWAYEISSAKSLNILLNEVLIFLILKKPQATLAIELAELQTKSKRNGKFNADKQKQIMLEIKKLNKKGLW